VWELKQSLINVNRIEMKFCHKRFPLEINVNEQPLSSSSSSLLSEERKRENARLHAGLKQVTRNSTPLSDFSLPASLSFFG